MRYGIIFSKFYLFRRGLTRKNTLKPNGEHKSRIVEFFLKKEKIMKKSKLITMAVSFLLAIGMVGAGFAAWVISAPTTSEATGSVTVDEVVDKRIKLTTATDDGTANSAWDANVVFGAPETQDINGAWLTATGDNLPTQDMNSVIKVTITNIDDLKNLDVETIKLEFSIAFENPADSENLTIVSFPESATVYNTTYADNESILTATETYYLIGLNDVSTSELVLYVDFAFTWNIPTGNGYSDQNPYNYYNNVDFSDMTADEIQDFVDDVKENLESMYELNDANLKITVKASVVA